MNDTKNQTFPMTGNIRPARDRVFIGLWALWALFLATPSLLFLAFGVVTLPFGNWTYELDLPSDWRGVALLVLPGTVLCSGLVGCIFQFVVLGYGSPLRLLRGSA